MGQALYRKYRSKSLAEIVGQEHITRTLDKALKSGRISHAYLFSGPRGVGKTSIARILAHEINDLPYRNETDEDAAHLDVIEIDAASNNGVEDVRDLREKVYVAPAAARYKVYIIDEVHMLSKAAFNALLKTLEEPPAHIVFILATTEAHKLPETIISRTQHFTFKPVEQAKVIEHLRHIAAEEGVKIDDEALALLAAHGQGSFRDSISLLDQARGSKAGGKAITVTEIRQLLGIAPDEAIDDLILAIGRAGQAKILLGQLDSMFSQGLQAGAIASQLAGRLRQALTDGKALLPVSQSLQLMRRLIEVPASREPARVLEITLLESADTSDITAPRGTAAVAAVAAPLTTKNSVNPSRIQPLSETPVIADAVVAAPAQDTSKKILDFDAQIWPQILDSVKKQYNTLYGVLRMATPVFSKDGVELQFKFAFHQKRLNEVKNKKIIADFIKQVTGSEVVVTCTYRRDITAPETSARGGKQPEPAASLEAISSIFGGGEVIEG